MIAPNMMTGCGTRRDARRAATGSCALRSRTAALLLALPGCVEIVARSPSDAGLAVRGGDAHDAAADTATDAPGDDTTDTSSPDALDAPADADTGCAPGAWLLPGRDMLGVLGPATPRAHFACTTERAAAQYFRLQVPPRRAVTLSLAARGAGAEHLRVQLLDDCGGRCLVGGDRSLSWRHDGASDRVVVAAVYGVGDSALDVAFALRLDIESPDPLAGCEVASPVALPARVTVTTPALVPRAHETCGAWGSIAWYRAMVPAGRILVAASTFRIPVTLIAASACDAGACGRAMNGVLRIPAASENREVYVGVAPTTPAPIEIGFDLLSEPAMGTAGTCERPEPLPIPAALDGPIFAAGEVPLDATCAEEGPRARFYRVEIPPRSLLTVESANDGAALAFVDRCGPDLCWTIPPNAQHITRTNASTDPVSVTLAVVRRTLGTLPAASLRARATPLRVELVCDTAPAIPPSGEVTLMLRNSDRTYGRTIQCGAAPFIAPSHFYTLDVPPRTAVRIEVPEQWHVALIPRCGEWACVGASTFFPPVTARWSNDADSAARVLVAVSDVAAQRPGTLRAELVPYEASMRCETGRFITDVPQETSTRYGVELRVCWSAVEYPKPAAWWRLRVPVGRQARVVVEGPPSSFQPFLNVSRTCGAFDCVPTSFLTTGERAEVVVINEGPGETLYVQLVADEARRRISATLEDPPSNRRCADATPLTPGVERSAERLPASGDLAPACAPIGWTVPAAYYRVEVPPHARLRVTARAHQPVTLRLYDGCAATTCAAASELSQTPTLTWTNATDAPATRLVAVSSRDRIRDRAREGLAITAAIEPAPDGG